MKTRKLLAFLISIAVLVVTAVSVTVLAEDTYSVNCVNNSNQKLDLVSYSKAGENEESQYKTSFAEGDLVYVRVNSIETGYTVNVIEFEDSNGMSVDFKEYGSRPDERVYSFTMPSNEVTVTISAKKMATLEAHIQPLEAADAICAFRLHMEDYLNRCIDSLIHQTYSNIELLLVDDGSTDNNMIYM